jgi:endonuclease/exonuclease/phosphatase (EEP) superfamily protein YafD
MVVKGIFTALGIAAILATIAPFLKKDDWWIRAFDFPRVQICVFTTMLSIALFFIFGKGGFWLYLFILILIFCAGYQFVKIYPYTWLAKKQVIKNRQATEDSKISILVANVLAPNRRAADLLKIIKAKSPDIVLTLESDTWWEQQMQPLEADYPYRVKKPLDNLYGMHLYSRLALVSPEVKYLVEEDIPSIHTSVKMRNGHRLRLYCLHPTPPSPTESETSTERDAELLMVAKHIKQKEDSVIVAGDLNDVAWSRTTRLFQEISGLLDPRVGRGFFSTFHAKYPFLRWPLDHIFHSNDFMLVSIDRLPYFGSDHFPLFAEINYQPGADSFQEKPEAQAVDEEWAEEKIKKAAPHGGQLSE